MVRYLILLLLTVLVGCEINSQQLIELEKFNFENVKFNAVSKNIVFEDINNNPDVEYAKEQLNKWFDEKIKVDGIDGELSIFVKSIQINKVKEVDFYRFEINLNIDFVEQSKTMNFSKSYNLKSIEFGEINGVFSIKDQENLNKNITLKSIKTINKKLLNII